MNIFNRNIYSCLLLHPRNCDFDGCENHLKSNIELKCKWKINAQRWKIWWNIFQQRRWWIWNCELKFPCRSRSLSHIFVFIRCNTLSVFRCYSPKRFVRSNSLLSIVNILQEKTRCIIYYILYVVWNHTHRQNIVYQAPVCVYTSIV